MLALTLVFRKCGASTLRTLVARLIEEGGAIDVPTVAEHQSETLVDVRFGPLAGMREVSRFVQEWADTQPDIDYLGVREA
jgi:hypothetical protein